ncbi:TonB-dependent receptor [Adhaeribacter sp. BT258]|uniref:TonB-dependent receptor n=1 Tax=Adhaeribacter terrigena TaxID=2793070 RepID=A0ABS1C3X1_9BACT|nr:TonB-dependent receptor [Adhaeribacter terrigena]MBK0403235.1 TonB-dependent receptor [Adhaeribacter terrigena]
MKYSLLFLLFFLPFFVAGQHVRGKVYDAQTRQPLSGAAIAIIGSASGTLTDESGIFTLTFSGENDTVLVQLVGYSSLRIPVSGTFLEIGLQPVAKTVGEVIVRGYETNQPLLRTAGAIGLLTPRELQRFNQNSLVPALNTIPGVRMEERATASYRISIRGSSLRAPFGVRNVKMYLNGIPLVEANGTLPLNLLDAATINRVEVLKGPAGSVYGAGTGGTILLHTMQPEAGESSVAVQGMAGSFGLQKYAVTATTGGERSGLLVRYDKQKQDGYREHSAMNRDVVLLAGNFRPSEKQTFNFHTYYSKLFYELPGALTKEQFDENPRQARQLNKDQHASLNLNGLNIGLNQDYALDENWSNSTSVFGVFSFLDHPFTNDYERNTNQAFGARTKTTLQTNLGNVWSRFSLGAEAQRSFVNSRHYQNNKGMAGILSFDDEVTAQQGFIFAQAEADLPGNITATLGGSVSALQYELNRVSDITQTNVGQHKRSFEPQFSPRLALVKLLTEKIALHGSISQGFSAPTEAEIRPSDGSFNSSLQPERGTNYELGFRGSILKEKLHFDVVGFWFRLQETIVSRSTENGVVVFQNAGQTRQQGLETSLTYEILNDTKRYVSGLKIWSSHALNHFRFQNYRQNEQDFSGNKLTGSPGQTLTSGLDLETRSGFYLNITSYYSSEIPLNDANTVFADSYLVAGARIGFRRQFFRNFQAEIYGGVENATDEKYSLGNDLNGFGNRYFNAAPGRYFYAGLQLKWNYAGK